MSKASFLLRPRWLVSHIFVAALVVTMVNLGFWQLDRLDQRRERNDVIKDRQEEQTVTVETLLSESDGAGDADEVRFRTVEATGTYDDNATFEVRNRTQDGAPGVWAVTPLGLETGETVGVIRGFAGLGPDGAADTPPAPDGEVTVTGVLAAPDGFDGTAPQDLDPFLAETGTLPGLVMASSTEPPEDDESAVLHPVPLPDLEEGPHLAYAGQWFIFSAIAAGGYPLVLRRIVRRRAQDEARDKEMHVRSNGQRGEDDRELDDILGSGSAHG